MEGMTFEALVNFIVQNGMSVVIIGYFLFKDYKFNEQILDVLGELKEVMAVVNSTLKEEHHG